MSDATEVRDGDSGAWNLALALLLVPMGIWQGYALEVLWRWFALPLGAPVIGMMHFAGLKCIWHAWSIRTSNAQMPTAAKFIGNGLVTPPFLLALGALFHWWM